MMDDLFNVNDAEHVKFGYKLDMKYKSLIIFLYFSRAHYKPNLEIWQFLPFKFLFFHNWKLSKSINILILCFGEILPSRKKVDSMWNQGGLLWLCWNYFER